MRRCNIDWRGRPKFSRLIPVRATFRAAGRGKWRGEGGRSAGEEVS